MKTKKDIENAVAKYYKVPVVELYTERTAYPHIGAHKVLIWLLYANGEKSYAIAKYFALTSRSIYLKLAEVSVALKSDTKMKQEIDEITKMLNNQK